MFLLFHFICSPVAYWLGVAEFKCSKIIGVRVLGYGKAQGNWIPINFVWQVDSYTQFPTYVRIQSKISDW